MINSTHPQYDNYIKSWDRCRDTYTGEEAVKKRGEVYLPRLGGQTDAEYNAYLTRAPFFNGIGKTVDGMVGTSMHIEPVITGVPDDMLEDITGTGISTKGFINYLLTEQLLTGRQGILVDHNGDFPYLSGYKTEQITNWSDNFIILKEQYQVKNPEKPYEVKYETQYRELTTVDGIYEVYIWRKLLNKYNRSEWVRSEVAIPTKRGAPLSSMMFLGSSLDGLNLTPEIPPLMPLVDMNLSHYRSSADLEHGRHFTALPTPYVIGVKDVGDIRLGAETAWAIPNEKAKVGFLEFTGQGLASLESAIREKSEMMAALGVQLISGQRKGVESFEALALKRNAELSSLVLAIHRVEVLMTNALQMAVDWAELESTVTVKLNLNFALGDEDEHLDDKADKDKKQAQKEQKKKEGDTVI